MGETTGTEADEAEEAAGRLEAALARIAASLAKSTMAPNTALLAARLDGLIEIMRAELTAAAPVGKTD